MTTDKPFGHCPIEGCHLGAMKGMTTCGFHIAPVANELEMTNLGKSHGTYAEFRAQGWTDSQLIVHGYAIAYESQYTVAHWEKYVRNLADAARHSGFIVRIDQVPDGPPAMGKHRDVVTVYEVRK